MHTRMRLGELLLASGLLSADQLEAALQGQRSSGMKLGEYLIKQGIAARATSWTPCAAKPASNATRPPASR